MTRYIVPAVYPVIVDGPPDPDAVHLTRDELLAMLERGELVRPWEVAILGTPVKVDGNRIIQPDQRRPDGTYHIPNRGRTAEDPLVRHADELARARVWFAGKSLTQEALAEYLGYDTETVRDWFRGGRWRVWEKRWIGFRPCNPDAARPTLVAWLIPNRARSTRYSSRYPWRSATR